MKVKSWVAGTNAALPRERATTQLLPTPGHGCGWSLTEFRPIYAPALASI